jgi:MarR family transcriptional regulator, organic hydroperoxide resistance regulator
MKKVVNLARPELFRLLIREMRLFIAGAILFNQRVADQLGINATDHQVLNHLDLLGSATPGRLAQLTGLTTGGITLVLDRLESAKYLKRERNPKDRRSWIIRPNPARMGKVFALYKPIDVGMDRLASRYSNEELCVVLDFFAQANRARDAMRAETPAAG